jgi:ABC-2 type transport system ATP-binding protein
MPDLPDPADSGRRGGELIDRPGIPGPAGSRSPRPPSALAQTTPAPERTDGPPALPDPPLLVFERVSKFYGPVIGVNQVTLELRPGITGLVGANGAGKSTLMRLAAGQARPDLGSISISGHDARSTEARLRVGYCPEVDSFYEELSGRQFVFTLARLSGYSRGESHRRTEEVLGVVGMSDRSDRRLRGYSKGMRQRIKLAQALLADPPLLLLDEPLSGIDPVGRQEMIGLFLKLAERRKCLLISSHELEELEKLTEQVAIMAHGRIAAVGSVAQIRERLEDQPLSIRIDVERDDAVSPPPGTNGMFHVEHSAGKDHHRIGGGERHRELAARLIRLPQVVSVEVVEDDLLDEPVGRLIVRARQPRTFFRDFARLVLEEWYQVRHLAPLDESVSAVLGYLLGGRPR